VEYTVLVPNLRGAERAMESRADELNLVMSTSETHNLANLRMPREKSFAALADVIRFVDGRTPINVSLSTAFGCPMEGEVPQEVVLGWSQRFADLGVRGLTICDTTGMAHPAPGGAHVRGAAAALSAAAAHAALPQHARHGPGQRAGRRAAGHHALRRSLGGLGGCPYAPGASGNISSEDAIHMLDEMGYDTGMDLDRLLQVARALPAIVGHEVPGPGRQGRPSRQLHPVPAAVTELRATLS
jgi:hydroxymethylglutaryl-CoA lyase